MRNQHSILTTSYGLMTLLCVLCGKIFSQSDLLGHTFLGTFEGHSYYLSECTVPWLDANDAATHMGGYLATIISEEEHSFLLPLAPETFYDASGGAWMGLTFTGTNWKWSNGEPFFYENWYTGLFTEPQFHDAAMAGCFEGCIESDGWRTAPNYFAKQYIVEFDGDPGCSNPDKTYVCHNGNTICVSNDAVQAHLHHGDYAGPCGPCNSSALMTLSDEYIEAQNHQEHETVSGFNDHENPTILQSSSSAELEVLLEDTDQTPYFAHVGEDAEGNVVISSESTFVGKFNPITSSWQWENQIIVLNPENNAGGILTRDMAVEPTGNIYLTGYYWGIVQFGGIALTSTKAKSGSTTYYTSDLFVAKLNTDGTFLWAKSFGSNLGPDHSEGIEVDDAGNVYVTGQFSVKSNCASKKDIYIAKLNSSGIALWQKKYTPTTCSGGGGTDIDIDPDGNVYFTGSFAGTYKFGSGAGLTITAAGGYDVFTAKLDPAGNAQWVRTGAGLQHDVSSRIYVDDIGQVWSAGTYGNASGDLGESITFDQITLSNSGGDYDGFLVKYTTTGTVEWAVNTASFTVHGWVRGLIPYGEDALLLALNPIGLKTISSLDGEILGSISIEGNFENMPHPDLYKFEMTEMEAAVSGFVFVGRQFCGDVTMSNLILENESCMNCLDECGPPESLWHSVIIRTTSDNPLIAPPPAESDEIVYRTSSGNEGTFQIFPNPASDEITISLFQSSFPIELTLCDQMGNALLNRKLVPGQQILSLTLDRNSIPTGIYYLNAVSGDEVLTKRLVIWDW